MNSKPHTRPVINSKPHTRPFRQLEIDGMPVDIALQNIVAPTQNTSSSFRRACMKAREKHFISDSPPKMEQQRLSNRMKHTPVDRLVRLIRRSNKRLKFCQKQLAKIEVEFLRERFIHGVIEPLVHRGIAAQTELQRRAKQIELFKHNANP